MFISFCLLGETIYITKEPDTLNAEPNKQVSSHIIVVASIPLHWAFRQMPTMRKTVCGGQL